MPTVEIEYCVPRGFLPRAEEVQHALLENFGQELDRVTIVTGDSGPFRIEVEDQTVFDRAEEGDAYDVDDVVRRVKDEL